MLSTTALDVQYHVDYDQFIQADDNEFYPNRSENAWAENQQLYQELLGIAPTQRYTWYPDIIPYPSPQVTDDVSIETTTTASTCESTTANSTGNSLIPPDNIETKSTIVTPNSNTMYHNPHYLGTLNYYYPPRLQQATTLQNIDSSNIPQVLPNGTETSNNNQTHSHRYHQMTLDNNMWDSFQDSCNALNPNEPWGDDYSIKHSNSFRIYFQNVNSLGLSSDRDKFRNILSSMIKSECDIINWSQTSLNWKLLNTRNKVHEIIRATNEIYKDNIGRNKYISPSPVIPGGTAQLIRGDWTGRIIEFVHDFRQLGRWCGVKLRLKHGRHLYLITAYRVCDQ